MGAVQLPFFIFALSPLNLSKRRGRVICQSVLRTRTSGASMVSFAGTGIGGFSMREIAIIPVM
jgi:hypothetical protein